MMTLKRLFAGVTLAFAVLSADAMTLHWEASSIQASGVLNSPTEWRMALLDNAKVSREVVLTALMENDYETLAAALEQGTVYTTTGCVYTASGNGYWNVQAAPMPSEYEGATSLTFYTLVLDHELLAGQNGFYILTDLKTDDPRFGNQCKMGLGSLKEVTWSPYTFTAVETRNEAKSGVVLFWSGMNVSREGIATEPTEWDITLVDAAKVPRSEMISALDSKDYSKLTSTIQKGLVVSTTGRYLQVTNPNYTQYARWYWDQNSGYLPAEYTWDKYHERGALTFYTVILDHALSKSRSGNYMVTEAKSTWIAQIGLQCQSPFGNLKSLTWTSYSFPNSKDDPVPKKDPNVEYTVADVSATYDGKGHGVSAKVTKPASGAKVEYAAAVNGPWVNTLLMTNAETKTIYCRVSATGYTTIYKTASVAISPRKVTLTSASASKVYDGKALVSRKVAVSGDGFAAGEGASYAVTGSQTNVGSSKNTFTYTLNAGMLAANYSIARVYGTLTVTGKGDDPTPTPPPDPEPDDPEPDDPEPDVPEPDDPDMEHYLADPDEVEVADLSAAQVYNGCIVDDEGTLMGSIQVKAAKQKVNKKTDVATSKLTISVQMVGEKKLSIKGTMEDVESGAFEIETKGHELEIRLGANGLSGIFDGYTIDGARDLFSSKDKADKSDATEILNEFKAKGSMTLAWESDAGWNGLSLTVGSKGKTKVAGTLADGTKVSTSAQLVVGEEWCAVPVVYTKKSVSLAFTVWFVRDDLDDVEVVGLSEDVKAGALTELAEDATFTVDEEALADILDGDDPFTEYFPTSVELTSNGKKWTLPKAGKITMKKGEIDESKAGENPAGLKLTYKAKDGTFSGSFKVYTGEGTSKMKTVTVSVSGIMVDGVGYGTATIKKKSGTAQVTIE